MSPMTACIRCFTETSGVLLVICTGHMQAECRALGVLVTPMLQISFCVLCFNARCFIDTALEMHLESMFLPPASFRERSGYLDT
jgi:hypothetical protein